MRFANLNANQAGQRDTCVRRFGLLTPQDVVVCPESFKGLEKLLHACSCMQTDDHIDQLGNLGPKGPLGFMRAVSIEAIEMDWSSSAGDLFAWTEMIT